MDDYYDNYNNSEYEDYFDEDDYYDVFGYDSEQRILNKYNGYSRNYRDDEVYTGFDDSYI